MSREGTHLDQRKIKVIIEYLMLISITNIKTFLGFTGYYQNYVDAPPSFLMDSVTSPKKKTTKGEGVGMRSLARNISRVEGRVEAS